MSRFCLAATCAAVLLTAAGASAQTATVGGSVSNARGGVIAGADVTLRVLPPPGAPAMPANMPGMAPDRTTTSAANGTFTFGQVPPGLYVLLVDAPGFERSSQEVTVANQPQTLTVALDPLDVPGAPAPAAPTSGSANDPAALLDRIKTLEQRIADLEAGTVLSEPETRVKRIEVYIDKNGNEHDEPVPGAEKKVTYQRERVYRRTWLSEKLEQALGDENAKRIQIGVSAASVTQFAHQTRGTPLDPDFNNHFYQLASADLLFSAGIAQYTSFFADIVGLSGAPPDAEIPSLTLINSYTARLVRQNEVNVREAWLRTELFSQKLGLSAGRLDLANYFDRNAMANDETFQFISDALVNNPMLGLSSNGAGVVGVFDPKNGFAVKGGFQQSNTDATNLSDSIFSMIEADYVARPPGLSEGNYRVWFRNDNSTGTSRQAWGLSLDQKLTSQFGLFGRYGRADADVDKDDFWSLGFQVQNGAVFNPLDFWGVGYSQTMLGSADNEKQVEGYYNFQISEKLRLSLHVQHYFERQAGTPDYGFLVPGVRLQARF
jgi:hypothetical protein